MFTSLVRLAPRAAGTTSSVFRHTYTRPGHPKVKVTYVREVRKVAVPTDGEVMALFVGFIGAAGIIWGFGK